jgi:two-component system chemotaxis response regulator CheY
MAKILIVDDARVMRFHIAKLIKELGHTVTAEAKDGHEALEEYKKNRPDFVTMDVEMPAVNGVKGGIDAVKKLLEIDKDAVVIMISSKTGDDNISDALKSGATNYIRKPITLEKLKNMIEYLSN